MAAHWCPAGCCVPPPECDRGRHIQGMSCRLILSPYRKTRHFFRGSDL